MKEKYRILCEKEKSIPLFSQAWWLDCVCGKDDWDVCLVEKGGVIIASMPYYITTRYCFSYSVQPKLTQNLGPWIRQSDAKYSKRLGHEKKILTELFSQLPKTHHFQQNWDHKFNNWLPIYWLGYVQSTRYTYRLNDLSNLDGIYRETLANIKTDIKKAINKYSLVVTDELPFSEFLKLNHQTYLRQSIDVPYSDQFVSSLISEAKLRNQAKWLIAKDADGRNHAGVLIVWDENSAYYLMGGGDPELRNSGATSLCMWEAIKFSATVTKSFDFEGSMLESVERFFRAFGAEQTPYFSISKTTSKILKIRNALKEII
ncbi:GNAT family N-acetyltransferase [Vibrio sp. TRT 29B02]|uniref:GNAT family N-acetyltransferase n=1 Tax=Vibrio sp. TRT 29B02 TaxID=3418508 RepID=UPI003CF9D0BE